MIKDTFLNHNIKHQTPKSMSCDDAVVKKRP